MAMGGGSAGSNGAGGNDPPSLPRIVGEVALDLATTPEGRAVGLSVEIWPDEGVWMRVRPGHELRLYAQVRDDKAWILWERSDPGQGTARKSTGEVGPARTLGEDDLRAFIRRWLSWRASH